MRKEADAKTRSIEALIGAAIGAPAGAIAGAATHKTEEPLEWTDEQGNVWARHRTKAEKEARLDRAAKAAVAGLALGAAGSLGVSAARRGFHSHLEQRKASKVLEPYITSLRKYISDLDRMASTGDVDARGRAEIAKRILRGEEEALPTLLGKAREERGKKLYGGLLVATQRTGPPSGKQHMRKIHLPTALEGQLVQRFENLSKRVGAPWSLTDEGEARKFWTRAVNELEKKSEVCALSCIDELRAIRGE